MRSSPGLAAFCGVLSAWLSRHPLSLLLASRFQSPERDKGGGDMTLLRIVGESASSHTKPAAAADDPDGAGAAVTAVAAGADCNNGSVNGTRLSVIRNHICFGYNLSLSLLNGRDMIWIHNATIFMFVTVFISFSLLFIKMIINLISLFTETRNYTSGSGGGC